MKLAICIGMCALMLSACSNMNNRQQKVLSGAVIGAGVGAAAGAVVD